MRLQGHRRPARVALPTERTTFLCTHQLNHGFVNSQEFIVLCPYLVNLRNLIVSYVFPVDCHIYTMTLGTGYLAQPYCPPALPSYRLLTDLIIEESRSLLLDQSPDLLSINFNIHRSDVFADLLIRGVPHRAFQTPFRQATGPPSSI